MKRLALFIVCSLFASAIAKTADQTNELRAIYAKLATAFAHKDAATLSKFLAANYTASGPDGKVVMDRAKRVEDLNAQFSHLSNIRWTPTLNSFKRTSSGTVVSISTHMTATIVDEKKKRHAFVFNGRSEDTWAKGKSGWQEVHVKVLSGGGTLDGHPMGGPPAGHGK
jgi:hypothetical protein